MTPTSCYALLCLLLSASMAKAGLWQGTFRATDIPNDIISQFAIGPLLTAESAHLCMIKCLLAGSSCHIYAVDSDNRTCALMDLQHIPGSAKMDVPAALGTTRAMANIETTTIRHKVIGSFGSMKDAAGTLRIKDYHQLEDFPFEVLPANIKDPAVQIGQQSAGIQIDEKTLMYCGGASSGVKSDKCHLYTYGVGWSLDFNTLTEAWEDGVLVNMGTFLWMVGGNPISRDSSKVTATWNIGTAQNWVSSHDLDTGMRRHCVANIDNNRAFIGAGTVRPYDTNDFGTIFNEARIFNFADAAGGTLNPITRVTNMTYPRKWPACDTVTLAGSVHIIVAGGVVTTPSPAEIYDVDNDIWSDLTGLLPSMGGPGHIIVGNEWYITGSRVWVFDLTTSTWTDTGISGIGAENHAFMFEL